ncbi:hypothetical protein IV203_022390 [Nitzschia inconspicua]|uniref:Uncharacterized protein n=1 Tax=Nitzschia inconspicua TaxID=303405 RepID=A0A9K3PEA7_9STRA|nr:hypothetical protein IV203_022390 [Nitzschia inconspicua]
MRLDQRFNRPDPSTRWKGDGDINCDSLVRQANRFEVGKNTPSTSSAVIETVYRKPRTYANVHEYDEQSHVVDRVPTAVGFHSFDSMDEIKSRHSRYDIEVESLENKLDLDWVVDQIPDTRNAPNEEEQTFEQENDSEREPPIEKPHVENAEEEEAVSEIGRYAAVAIDESIMSVDSDSCPALWVNESQEDIRLRTKDYKEALEEAKRLKGLNDVRMEKERDIKQNAELSSTKQTIRRGRQAVALQKKEENERGVESVDSLGDNVDTKEIECSSEVSSMKQNRKAAGWNRWMPHFLRESKSVSSGTRKSASSSQEPSSRASTPVTTVSTQNDTQGNKFNIYKPSRTGPIDVDEISTAETFNEHPTASKTSSNLHATSIDVIRSFKTSIENASTANGSKGSSKSKESRESLRQKSLVDIVDDSSNPPVPNSIHENNSIPKEQSGFVSETSPERPVASKSSNWKVSHNKPDDIHSQDTKGTLRSSQQKVNKPSSDSLVPKEAEANVSTIITKDTSVDPPGAESLAVLQKRSSGRSSSRRSRDNDSESSDTDNDSYASSDRQVSNDDIIKAVRGEKPGVDDHDVVKNIDGLTSWIISGFDSLAGVGLKNPIRFLDWSGEETRMHNVEHANVSQVDPPTPAVTDNDGTSQGPTVQSGAALSESPENMVISPRSQVGDISRSGPGENGQLDYEKQEEARNAIKSPRRARDQREPNKFLVGKPGLVKQRIATISSREMQQHSPALDHDEKEGKLKTSISNGSAEVKSLKLQTGVEVKVPDTTEQQIEQRNREVLERRSRKLMRDNVSISSIEIPTPNREKTEDEYSVSILGLQKGERTPNIKDERILIHQHSKTAQSPLKKDEQGIKRQKLRQQRIVGDQRKSDTVKKSKHRKHSQSPHQSRSRGKSPSVKKRQESVKVTRTETINATKKPRKNFPLFGRKKE